MKSKHLLSMISVILILSILLFLFQIITVCSAETDSDSVGYSMVNNNTTFYLKNAHSGQYLDLDHGTDQNNTNIFQWKYNGGKNQQWKFVQVGTVNDGYLYKIVSANSSSDRVIDVSAGGSANGQNIALYKYKGSSNQQFALQQLTSGAYKILTKCSNYKSAITIQGKSCAQKANAIQYQYNASHNDEWYLEPVNKSNGYGLSYATRNAENYKQRVYPYLSGGDCANFVSQCMVASGIHYKEDWYIYKKNNNYLAFDHTDINKLNNSWELSSPSPWISAKYFSSYWTQNAYDLCTASGKDLYNGKSTVKSCIGVGDVVQYGKNTIFGYEGEHTMYITNRNGNNITVSYHSNDSKNVSLNQLYNKYSDKVFRFYDVI